jgi:hypothetical protein
VTEPGAHDDATFGVSVKPNVGFGHQMVGFGTKVSAKSSTKHGNQLGLAKGHDGSFAGHFDVVCSIKAPPRSGYRVSVYANGPPSKGENGVAWTPIVLLDVFLVKVYKL